MAVNFMYCWNGYLLHRNYYNMALTTVAIPIIFSLCQMTGLNPYLYMMVATICASYTFVLPIVAPNAIAMAAEPFAFVKWHAMDLYNIIAILITAIVANLSGQYFSKLTTNQYNTLYFVICPL